jgi:outer membrane protein OmpA-like peptidoglycan-associated protein/opacity protein-like surface antigen
MQRFTMALVALLLVASSPASASRGAKGSWELGIYGGYGWLDDYGDFQPKNHFLYGGRLGYFFSRHWSMEVSAQRLSTHTDFDIIGVQNVDMHLDAVRLNALYNFGGEHVRPFLTAGVGHEKTDVTDYGRSCDIGWNAGAGFRWYLSDHWNLRADGRYVHTHVGDVVDASENNVEATLGLGLNFGGHHKVKEVEVAPVNQPPTASLACERAELLPGETMSVTATASDPEGDPLTYDWSATAGHVAGNGATATFDFTGVTPPATSTITVKVSDNHAHTTSADCSVSLRQPAPPPEAVSCLSGGFPRNLSRLNNVDKACLDDMAQRLKTDPRAHVIVIGYADSHERAPDRIGQARAQAVSDYVVQERGVEASRITTRSAGAGKPLDTGTDLSAQARNRRVEVWFVPEGAKDPD